MLSHSRCLSSDRRRKREKEKKKVDGRLADEVGEDFTFGHSCRTETRKGGLVQYFKNGPEHVSPLTVSHGTEHHQGKHAYEEIHFSHDRLKATHMFLATGQTYEELLFTTSVSAQLLGRIIPETCKAIWDSLQEEYVKVSN